MLARRLLLTRTRPYLPEEEVLSPYFFVVGGKGILKVEPYAPGSDAAKFTAMASTSGSAQFYPRISTDEVSFAFYNASPAWQIPVKMPAIDFVGTAPSYLGWPQIAASDSSRYTLMRDCYAKYANATNISSVDLYDWSGSLISTLSLSDIPRASGTLEPRFFSTSGRYSLAFNSLNQTLPGVSTDYTATPVNTRSRLSNYSTLQNSQYVTVGSGVPITPTTIYPAAVSISTLGALRAINFDEFDHLEPFSKLSPEGAEDLPLIRDRRVFQALAFRQVRDALYILAYVERHCVWQASTVDTITYGSNLYHFRARAAYGGRQSLVILKLQDESVTLAKTLVRRTGFFPAAYYNVHKSSSGAFSEIEFVRPPFSDYLRDTNNSGTPIAFEVPESSWIAQFGARSEPSIRYPGFPIIGFESGEDFNVLPELGQWTTTGLLTTSFHLGYSNKKFYLYSRRRAVDGVDIQPIYEISNTVRLIRSEPFADAFSLVSRFEVFQNPPVILAQSDGAGTFQFRIADGVRVYSTGTSTPSPGIPAYSHLIQF